MAFRRSLNDGFIEALNDLHKKGSWWKTLVERKDVFLAIRDNCINAYCNGGSLAQIKWDGKKVLLKVHEEYLTLRSENKKNRYILLTADKTITRKMICTPKDYLDDISNKTSSIITQVARFFDTMLPHLELPHRDVASVPDDG